MLSYVNLYLNTVCNSRCITCSFWKQAPRHVLETSRILTIINSQFADEKTWFAVQGGEFTLHPQADLILEALRGKNFILFTNLLSPAKALDLVQRHNVRYVTVSLDGGKEGYKRIRGVDSFEVVTEGILRLKSRCEVSVGFTLTPWSTYSDYEQVARFCRGNGIEFGVNLYTASHIYEAVSQIEDYNLLRRIAEDCKDPFVAGYIPWRNGRLQLRCHSIREVSSIAPDGNVFLCHNQPIALGNVNVADFDDIWGSAESERLHEQYATCNACWTSCYRIFDLDRARTAQFPAGEFGA